MAEAQAQVIYTNVAPSASVKGFLFAGKKFWIAQRTPSRSHFVDLVRSNGGDITQLEKQADYLICDHLRQDVPPGGISYKFIEQSIRDGRIADPQEHTCAPPKGAARALGSSRPASRVRKAYTAEEDRLLYKWVKDAEARNVAVLGNELYKQLEQYNNSHPWQSWRDRYIKQLQYSPPAAWETVVIGNERTSACSSPAHRQRTTQLAPPQPPARQNSPDPIALSPRANVPRRPLSRRQALESPPPTGRLPPAELRSDAEPERPERPPFLAQDFFDVFQHAADIVKMPYEEVLQSFQAWAADQGVHTAEEWQEFFAIVVVPFHNRLLGVKNRWRAVHDAMKTWLEEHPDGSPKEWMVYYTRHVEPNLSVLEAAVAAGSEDEPTEEEDDQPNAADNDLSGEPEEADRRTEESDSSDEVASKASLPTGKRYLDDETLPVKAKRQRLKTAPEGTVSDLGEYLAVSARDEVLEVDAIRLPTAINELGEGSEETGTSSDEEDSQPTGNRLDRLATSQLRFEMIGPDLPPSLSPAGTPAKPNEIQSVADFTSEGTPQSPEAGNGDPEGSFKFEDASLSQHATFMTETQAILAAPTQAVDLELAEPEGGFTNGMEDVDSLADMDLDLVEPEDGFENVDSMMIDTAEDKMFEIVGQPASFREEAEDREEDHISQKAAGVIHEMLTNQQRNKYDREVVGEEGDELEEKTAAQRDEIFTAVVLPLESQEDSVLGRIPRRDDEPEISYDDNDAQFMKDQTEREIAETPQPDDQHDESSSWVHVDGPQAHIQEEEAAQRNLDQDYSLLIEEEGLKDETEDLDKPNTFLMSGALRRPSPDLGVPEKGRSPVPPETEGLRTSRFGVEKAVERSTSSSPSESASEEEAEDVVTKDDVATSEPSSASESIPNPVAMLQRRGYELREITAALYFTSGNGELSAMVAEELNSGRAVPDDEPGIWTESDDENLRRAERDGVLAREIAQKGSPRTKRRESGAAIKLRMLKAKHGRSGVLERREFLQSIGRL